jgi:hypothetical protein
MWCPRTLRCAAITAVYFVFAAPLHSLQAADEVDFSLSDIFFGSEEVEVEVEVEVSLFLSHPTTAKIMPSAATAIRLFITRLLAAPSHTR